MRAVIVDVEGKAAACMTEGGDIIKISNKNYEIGQTVELDHKRQVQKNNHLFKSLKKAGSLIAAVAVIAMAGSATAYALPYGTVSLNSEPGIEYTINCFNYVLDVSALNDDGETILENLDLSELRNSKVSEAVKITVNEMERSGYRGEDLEVTIDTGTKDKAHSDKLKKDLEESLKKDNKTYEQGTAPDEIYENESIPDDQNIEREKTFSKENSQMTQEGSVIPEESAIPEDPGTDIQAEKEKSLQNGEMTGKFSDKDIHDENIPENNDQNMKEGGGVPFIIHE